MKNWTKFALTGFVLATAVVGCKPMGENRPAMIGAVAPKAERKSLQLAALAEQALRDKKPLDAVTAAEQAVTLDPRNAAYRGLLGRAYLQAGRFQSAEESFGIALTLDASLGRPAVTRALALIALGRSVEAKAALLDARGRVPESDIGLGLALAGERDQAIAILEDVVRAPNATARARQNLALAYALAGRWNDAHAMASRDVPANQLTARLRHWAQIARPADKPYDQVATLLGVTPAEDPGQPVSLALAPEPVIAPMAEAPPADLMAAELASVDRAPEAAPLAEVAEPAMPVEQAQIDPAPVPAIDNAAYARGDEAIVNMSEASARPTPPLQRLSVEARSGGRKIVRPVMAVRSAKQQQTSNGRYVVQLGAFSSTDRVAKAWTKISAKSQNLAAYVPASAQLSSAKGTGKLYRLSLSGFESRANADQLCRQIRAGGTACFVRTVAGDRQAQWIKGQRKLQFASL